MINMKILRAGGEEFAGNSGGNPIRNIYMALEGADAMVLTDRNLRFSTPHTRMAAPCVDMPQRCVTQGYMTAHREFGELDLRRG